MANGCGGLFHWLRRPIRLFIVLVALVMMMGTLQIMWRFSVPLGFRRPIRDSKTDNYGIVIDAGSSGSRVHLFHWASHDGNPTKLLKIDSVLNHMGLPLVRKSSPGIASYPSDPELAYVTLIPLLDFAMRHIPRESHFLTPVYILGTAGMRMLSKKQQDRIMTHLRDRVAAQYPFYLPSDNVVVLSGKMEGVFSWITVNYLLGNFNHQHSINTGSGFDKIATSGVLEMGGASLQIAYEIPSNVEVNQDEVVDINLGCGLSDSHHRHRVFVGTYLGYGSNVAMSRYREELVQQYNTSRGKTLIRDHCLHQNLEENFTTKDGTQVTLSGKGDYRRCRDSVRAMLKANTSSLSDCSGTRCPVAPFVKPQVPFQYLPFLGTSEFWYTMQDVLHIGGDYNQRKFDRAATDFCHTSWTVLQSRYKKKLYPNADPYRFRSQCFKSAWMSAVLHTGLSFSPDDIKLQSTSSIQDRNVQWTLGAILYRTRFFPLREIQQAQMKKSPPSISNEVHSFIGGPFFLPSLLVLAVIGLLLYLTNKHPLSSSRSSPVFNRKSSSSRQSLINSQSVVTPRNSSSVKLLPISNSKATDYDYSSVNVKFFV